MIDTRNKVAKAAWLAVLAATAALLPACGPAAFPEKPLTATATQAAYDVDGSGRAGFYCFYNETGRINRIGYDRTGAGRATELVDLDAIPAAACRHLVLVLDGFPLDVVREFYAAGHLRLCHPPAAVIAPYPVLTDPSLEDAFGYIACLGYEAAYYNPRTGAAAGGTSDYLAGKGEPFTRLIQYRAGTLDDANTYLSPKPTFDKELVAAKAAWDRRESREFIAYFVSSAGLGSRLGKEGHLYALRHIEQLILQVLYETHGLVKVTLLADHGQTNIPCRPAKLDEYLTGKGWRVVQKLQGDKDVVLTKFGLVTYAALGTRQPAKLAADLIAAPTVELASYVEGDKVVVLGKGGEATIRSADGQTFEYVVLGSDPLKLDLNPSPSGGGRSEGPGEGAPATRPAPSTPFVIDGRKLFLATSDGKHEYPDALYRLWRGHFGLVENPADVLVTLDDRWFNGSGFFSGLVDMASTHGGLNWRNSATFLMSSAGPITGPLRSEDVPAAMKTLFLRPWPAGR